MATELEHVEGQGLENKKSLSRCMIVCVFVCVSVSVGFLAQVTLVPGSSIAWRACYHGRENSQMGSEESE